MRTLLAAAFALAFIAAGPAHALLCVPILGCSCTVTATDLAFDDFSPLAGGTQDGEGEVNVDCTGVVDVAPSVTVKVLQGQWGTIANRKMRSGPGGLLDYNIYTTAQRNVIWGNGTTGASVTVSGGLLSLGHWSVDRAMFGRAAPLATAHPGAYSDTVVVRVEW